MIFTYTNFISNAQLFVYHIEYDSEFSRILQYNICFLYFHPHYEVMKDQLSFEQYFWNESSK